MQNFLIGLVMLGLVGCAGIQGISVPDVQEFAYKDIVHCLKVNEIFSDCKIKRGGFYVVVRIQTSKIPTEPVQ